MNNQIPETRSRPSNDIEGLARALPELNPDSYFDAQARNEYLDALAKWPTLAKLLGLGQRR